MFLAKNGVCATLADTDQHLTITLCGQMRQILQAVNIQDSVRIGLRPPVSPELSIGFCLWPQPFGNDAGSNDIGGMTNIGYETFAQVKAGIEKDAEKEMWTEEKKNEKMN